MPRPLCAIVLLACCLPLAGCGGCGGVSASSAKRYARKGPADIPDGPPPPAKAAPAKANEPAAKAAAAPAKAGQPAVTKSAGEIASKAAESPAAPEASAEPEKRPETETERRARSISNLERIGKALNAYAAKHGKLPPFAESYDNELFLSWRVLILPELGYQELYNRFRRGEPWDSPHNKLLVDYIPREFQSPERFDKKTNYLALAGPGMALGSTAGLAPKEIKDGVANTLAIVEVEDRYATEWTRPVDHLPILEQPQQRLGALRGEGAFAILATGRVVLLPRDLAASKLAALFTVNGGEPLDAAQSFLTAPAAEPPPPMLATVADDPNAAATTAQTSGETTPAAGAAAAAPTAPADNKPLLGDTFLPDPKKYAVPDEEALAKSREQLRQLYAKEYERSRTRQQRQQLLTKLLADVPTVEDNPADLHELARIARDLAVSLGDLTPALAACEVLEQRFQIDPLPLRLKVLQDLAKQIKTANASQFGDDARLEALRIERLALDADRYDVAIPAHESQLTFARLHKDKKKNLDMTRLQQQADELDATKSLFLAAQRALALLKDQPGEATANEAVGRYLCFVKNRWEAGLPYLARSGDIRLRGIASLETASDRSIQSVLLLADQYWDLAGRTKPPQRRGLHLRAVYCYASIAARMDSSLEKVKAQKRHAEAVMMYGQDEVDRILAPLKAVTMARP